MTGWGAGAGSEAGHLATTASDRHGEVVERDELAVDHIVLVTMSNAGNEPKGRFQKTIVLWNVCKLLFEKHQKNMHFSVLYFYNPEYFLETSLIGP